MKRFRFTLDKVLRLRSQEMEQAKRALGLAVAAENAARHAVLTAHEALTQRTEEARRLEASGLSAFAFGSLRAYLALLQRELEAAEAALLEARALTERRREELLKARRRERALERLKERRLEQYTLESLREEQKELDEYGNRQGLNSLTAEPEI